MGMMKFMPLVRVPLYDPKRSITMDSCSLIILTQLTIAATTTRAKIPAIAVKNVLPNIGVIMFSIILGVFTNAYHGLTAFHSEDGDP